VGSHTRAAAILRLVERGAASKPALVDAAERIARHLTWVILLTALLSGWALGDPWIAVAVLVVACPCALALAAPLVLTRASGALLDRGVILARGRALEVLRQVTDVVLDKTGTLTLGRLGISSRLVLGALGEAECMRIAGALEASSRHPIARAFPAGGLAAQAVRHVAGMGIEGRVGARQVRIGNAGFCAGLCGAPAPVSGPASGTQVYLADERGWLARFDLQDELRHDAQDLVRELERRRLRVHLASGDAPQIVALLARRLGIRRARGAMTPQDKFAYVEALQREGGRVLMIGDGLNDAPVLARADASFAMGSGADAAQLQADLVLTSNSLAEIPRTLDLAGRAMRLVRQNLGWALAYNAVALPLAALGWIGPWEAALAMGASSLTVLLNALRTLGSGTPGAYSGRSAPSSALRTLSSPGGP
jgi:Cu2+-exporting ATPase